MVRPDPQAPRGIPAIPARRVPPAR
jgi:hypothetical protein